jgi:hypothetical protein
VNFGVAALGGQEVLAVFDGNEPVRNQLVSRTLKDWRILGPRRWNPQSAARRIEALVDYFYVVAVEVGEVGGVVARTEVDAYRRLTFTRTTRINRRGIRGIDLGLVVSNKSHVQPGLTGLPPA